LAEKSEVQMPETMSFAKKFLILNSLEKELDRDLETSNALQTRINTVIALSGTTTATLFGILGAILKFAETSSGWQSVGNYVPWVGALSMFLAWRFARGIRKQLLSTLEEANSVESRRQEIVEIPVRPFLRRLREEQEFHGVHRETWVILVISVLWGGYLMHTYDATGWLKSMFNMISSLR
jgi:hypothetical protein